MTNGTGTFRLPVGIRTVDVDRSGVWLSAGWRDFLKTPGISLAYGGGFVVLSLVLTYGLISADLGSLVLPLFGGLALLAPILVVGLYDVSRRLEQGEEVRFGDVFAAVKESLGQLSAMGMVLLLCWWIWIEIALFLFMIFYGERPPPLHRFLEDVVLSLNGAPFLIVGTLIGAIFAAVVFTITAVSIPLIYERPIDIVTAIATSILTVRANWQAMFGWAAMIAVFTACGAALFLVGLAVALPVLAYATWHAYRDLIDPEAPPVPKENGVGAGSGI